MRRTPDDFEVTEELGFTPSGDGEHDFLWVEKRGANTAWVATRLAGHAGIKTSDVGFAGLKDRHALTRQWFSVRRPDRDGTDWSSFAADGVRLLAVERNARKLRRGAHRANRFRIALRSAAIGANAAALEARYGRVAKLGFPNYFGEQRFGRDGGNLELAEQLFAGVKLRRAARGHGLSAARAMLFNAVLDSRVRSGTWNRLLPGERANLDASGSSFAVDAPTAELDERCRALDIHPTATLWGAGAPLSGLDAAQAETDAVAAYPELARGLTEARVAAASRPLRARVSDARIEIQSHVAWLEFRLVKGAFATALVRELVDARDQPSSSST